MSSNANTPKTPRTTRTTNTAKAYPVELLDPSTCIPSGLNREIFADDAWNVSTGEELPGEGLTESIIKTGGNLENGIVVRQSDGTYKILSGHRRWSICLAHKLPFRALVLPEATPAEEQVDMAVWANASQRDQSPIDRIRQAKHVEPQIREALAKNKQGGVALPTDEDKKGAYHGRFDDVVNRLFFEGRRSKGWCEQLRVVYEASTGEGTLLDTYTEERDRSKAQDRAREYVAMIHQGKVTVGEAFRKMQAVKKPRVASDGRVLSPDEEKAERKAAARRSALVSAISGLAQLKEPPVGLSDAEERMVREGAPVAIRALAAACLTLGGSAEALIAAVRDAASAHPPMSSDEDEPPALPVAA